MRVVDVEFCHTIGRLWQRTCDCRLFQEFLIYNSYSYYKTTKMDRWEIEIAVGNCSRLNLTYDKWARERKKKVKMSLKFSANVNKSSFWLYCTCVGCSFRV